MKFARYSGFLANLVLIAALVAAIFWLWQDGAERRTFVTASIPLKGPPKFLQVSWSAWNEVATFAVFRTDFGSGRVEAGRSEVDMTLWSPTSPDRGKFLVSFSGEFRVESHVLFLLLIPALWLTICAARLGARIRQTGREGPRTKEA